MQSWNRVSSKNTIFKIEADFVFSVEIRWDFERFFTKTSRSRSDPFPQISLEHQLLHSSELRISDDVVHRLAQCDSERVANFWELFPLRSTSIGLSFFLTKQTFECISLLEFLSWKKKACCLSDGLHGVKYFGQLEIILFSSHYCTVPAATVLSRLYQATIEYWWQTVNDCLGCFIVVY